MSIETYPDGISVSALVPATRRGLRLALGVAVALLLIGIAISSEDVWFWGGLRFSRAGTLARVLSGGLGALTAVCVVIDVFRPRLPATMTARGGQLVYSEAKFGGGRRHFECPLREIEKIERERSDGGAGGTLRVITRSPGSWSMVGPLLFRDLNPMELDSITLALLPVWKAAATPNAALPAL